MNQLSTYRAGNWPLMDGAATGGQQPPAISIKDNQFALIDPSGARTPVPFLKDGPAIDVVFVDRNEHVSKLFWGLNRPYNPNEVQPPVCFSDNGVAPSATAREPQSKLCNECPHNIIGSAISQISGARIKACGDLKKFAVVVKGYPGAYQLQIKPGSFKAWNNYIGYLRMQKLNDGGRPDLSDVVTRIRFSGQGILSFEAVELVKDGTPTATQVIEIWEKNKQNDITGMMVGRFDRPSQAILPGAPTPIAQVAPPPPVLEQKVLQGHGIFYEPQKADAGIKVETSPPAEKKPRNKKPAEKAAIEPPAPPAQYGMQTPQEGTPPADVEARLNSLFKSK